MTIVLLLVFIALNYFLIRGLINPQKALRGEKRTRLRVLIIYGFACFVCFIAISLSAHIDNQKPQATPFSVGNAAIEKKPELTAKVEENPEEVLKKKLQNVDSDTTVDVQTATAEGYRIVVNFEPKAIWDMPAYIRDIGFRIIKIGKKLKQENVRVSSFVYRGTVPTTDKYGNSGTSEAMTLTIKGEDFNKINWSDIAFRQILNLTEVYFTSLGRKGAIEFCNDKDNFNNADNFCSAVFK